MPKAGDFFDVVLKEVHIAWGIVGESRQGKKARHPEEAYIPIPLPEARRIGILAGTDFDAVSADGYINAKVKASGSTGPNNMYAKQFAGLGNLRLFGQWLQSCGVKPGDRVLVEFTSATSIKFTHLPV